MTDKDHRRVCALNKQSIVALFMKALIANSNDLVNQEAVKVDSEGEGKSKPRTHPRGIILDGQVELLSKLGEIIHKIDYILDGAGYTRAQETECCQIRSLTLRSRR